jgi:hypothetical protein
MQLPPSGAPLKVPGLLAVTWVLNHSLRGAGTRADTAGRDEVGAAAGCAERLVQIRAGPAVARARDTVRELGSRCSAHP